MRVIAGKAKGRTLKSPPDSTRPITDRAKESLFSILGDTVGDANVLDLFAGSGSVGIEALSRGARHSTFVEANDKALSTLRENLRLTGFADRATVVRANVFKFLKQPSPSEYDLVYVAPPQYKGLWRDCLLVLDNYPHISEQGEIVVQIHPKEFQEIELASVHLADQRKYGSTLLCFYERNR